MRRCFDLAQLGRQNVKSNPVVGALLVRDQQVISEDFHQFFGGPHAEVNVLEKVNVSDVLEDAAMYVSLEPCTHQGKTPPCANLIVQRKVAQVVISVQDPNPEVNGAGITVIRNAGTKVFTDCLGSRGEQVVRPFLRRQRTHRPYVILKWAESADGFLGIKGKRTRISHVCTDRLVHKWRAESDAILVGSGTALIDNPSLTTRHYFGGHPLRVLVDRRSRASENLQLLDGKHPTIWYTEKAKSTSPKPYDQVQLKPGNTLVQVLQDLKSRDMGTVMVEGGARILCTFLHENLWDECRIIKSRKQLGTGIAAPIMQVPPNHRKQVTSDIVFQYFNSHF